MRAVVNFFRDLWKLLFPASACHHTWKLDPNNSAIRTCTKCQEEQWFITRLYPRVIDETLGISESTNYWETRREGRLPYAIRR